MTLRAYKGPSTINQDKATGQIRMQLQTIQDKESILKASRDQKNGGYTKDWE